MLKIPDKAGTIYAKYANVSPECQFAKITNEPEFSFWINNDFDFNYLLTCFRQIIYSQL